MRKHSAIQLQLQLRSRLLPLSNAFVYLSLGDYNWLPGQQKIAANFIKITLESDRMGKEATE